MARKTTAYDRIRKARSVVYSVMINFATGQQLTGVMDLTVRQLEQMRRDGEITTVATCTTCGEDVTQCPNIGPYLLGWEGQVETWHDEDGLVALSV